MASSGDAPTWYYFSEAAKGWAIVVGAIVVFSLYGCRSELLDLKIKEVDAMLKEADQRIATATEQTQIRLREYEARAKGAEATLSEAQTAIANVEIAKRTTPVMTVTPVVEQGISTDDIREVRLEIQCTNTGDVPVTLKNVGVSVYRGNTSEAVYEIIRKTQDYAEAKRVLRTMDPTQSFVGGEQDEQTQQRREWARSVVDAHDAQRMNCFHGSMFLISSESEHVEWSKVQGATRRRESDITLAPGDSVSEQFNYLLTEAQSRHWNWFRFQASINEGLDSEKTIEFVLPALRTSDYEPRVRTETVVREASQTSHRWEPSSPLLPLAPTRNDE